MTSQSTDDLARLLRRGRNLYGSERYADAREVLRSAIAPCERTWGSDDVQLIEALEWLAMALSEKDYGVPPPEVVALHARMLRIAEAGYGPEHIQTGGALYIVSLDLASLGRRDEALAHRVRSFEIAHRVLGDDHHFVREVRGALGSMLTEAGRPEEAVPLLKREAEIADAQPHDVTRMIAHRSLGRALLRAGLPDEAVVSLQIALALAEATRSSLGRELGEWLDQARAQIAATGR